MIICEKVMKRKYLMGMKVLFPFFFKLVDIL